MQAFSTPLVLSFIGEKKKKITENLTFLLLVSKVCVVAISLYSPLHLTNRQSVSNIQNLFKIEYKQDDFAWLGVTKF